MLIMKVVRGPKSVGQSYPLQQGQMMTIGRDAGCEIQLPSTGVSKRHARLTLLPGSRVEVEDMGSDNGTFVNGILIKKHVLKPGDSLSIHDFILQVGVKLPQVQAAPSPGLELVGGTGLSPNIGTSAPAKQKGLGALLQSNIYPWADGLSAQFDIRKLVVGFFAIWSVLIIVLTAMPFSRTANKRIQEESTNIAKLFSRQLVRANQQAIIDQRFRDLTVALDARSGDTEGLQKAYILDAKTGLVLAPAEIYGTALAAPQAAKAIKQDGDWSVVDSEGISYASSPVKVGSATGNITVATAFVTFDADINTFRIANIVDQILNSMLIALAISVLFFILLERWVQGALVMMGQRVDVALKTSEVRVESPVKWPALEELAEMISGALGRAAKAGGGGEGASTAGNSTEWAHAATKNTTGPGAAFDTSFRILAWNPGMESLMSVRESEAVGSDLSSCSREITFETIVKDLANLALLNPWLQQSRRSEVSGSNYQFNMILADGIFLLSLAKAED